MSDFSSTPPSSSMPCNLSDNCYYGLNLREKILKVLDECEEEITPVEVARRFHGNPSSVRVFLRRLLEQGRVLQPYPGAYCNERIHGVRFLPLKVHNIVFTVEEAGVEEHWEWKEEVGLVSLKVIFGTERDKVSCFISCDVGMDRNTCIFALEKCVGVIEQKLGHVVEDVVVRTFEANKDYSGARLDGVHCLTVKGLFDVVERVYQKEANLVRHELKVSSPTGLEAFIGLLQGGVSQYNVTQANYALIQKVNELSEVLKSTNSNVLQLTKVTEAMFNHQVKEIDKKNEQST